MMAKDVAFRRIKGRIIPIKAKESPGKKVAKGAALTTAGAATALTAGDAAARATKEAAKFRVNSRVYGAKAQDLMNKIRRGKSATEKFEKAGQMAFDMKIKPSAPKSAAFEKIAVRSALKSKGFRLMRKGLYAGGLATSTALLSTGFKKMYEGTTGNKADTKQDIIATAAGAGSTFALSSAYAHRIAGGGRKNVMKAIKFGLRASKIKV